MQMKDLITNQADSDLQKRPSYVGNILPNCDYHHGQIVPAKGVSCYQIVRANRSFPELADGTDTTYKHAPDLTYFHGTFYVQYLCNPKDEHADAGISVLAASVDGITWDKFQVSFPAYKIPKGSCTDYKGLVHQFTGETYAFMHQRMSFFRSSSNHMLICGFYGWSKEKWMTNWDNYGIGRVVRELHADGTLGGIYFIRPNKQSGFHDDQYLYPMYDNSSDNGFVEACEELLKNPFYVQQWAEENGDIDPLIKIKHPGNGKTYQAFCWYHINESRVIGLWKHSMTAYSEDGGVTFSEVRKSPSLVMSGQKVWGQKTSDDRFALVYDPTLETEHRYPLCLVTSEDGVNFDQMRLIHGEVPPKRFQGFWKDFGPQYMRGMTEGLITEADHPGRDMYVVYSVNKEDIWIARIPIPVEDETVEQIQESFDDQGVMKNWNIYSPKWAPVTWQSIHIRDDADPLVKGKKQGVLRLADEDPYDYCMVERVLTPSPKKRLSFTIIPGEQEDGLVIEVCNAKAQPAIRLVFRKNGWVYARTVTEINAFQYEIGKQYEIVLEGSCEEYTYTITVNGAKLTDTQGNVLQWSFMTAVSELSRFMVRTGARRSLPDLEMASDASPKDILPGADIKCSTASCDMLYFSSVNI